MTKKVNESSKKDTTITITITTTITTTITITEHRDSIAHRADGEDITASRPRQGTMARQPRATTTITATNATINGTM